MEARTLSPSDYIKSGLQYLIPGQDESTTANFVAGSIIGAYGFLNSSLGCNNYYLGNLELLTGMYLLGRGTYQNGVLNTLNAMKGGTEKLITTGLSMWNNPKKNPTSQIRATNTTSHPLASDSSEESEEEAASPSASPSISKKLA